MQTLAEFSLEQGHSILTSLYHLPVAEYFRNIRLIQFSGHFSEAWLE